MNYYQEFLNELIDLRNHKEIHKKMLLVLAEMRNNLKILKKGV